MLLNNYPQNVGNMWIIVHTLVFKLINSVVDREDKAYNLILDSTYLSTL